MLPVKVPYGSHFCMAHASHSQPGCHWRPVFAFTWYVLSRSLPDYTKTVQFEQLIAPVEIVRDTANVPHIFGKNDHDTLFALGYAHAQDRLWQMTMLRRTAQGRLSELFGEATLPIDMMVRRLAIYSAARQSLSALRPDTLAKLDAYALGVNARLLEINNVHSGGARRSFSYFPTRYPRGPPPTAWRSSNLWGFSSPVIYNKKCCARGRLSF